MERFLTFPCIAIIGLALISSCDVQPAESAYEYKLSLDTSVYEYSQYGTFSKDDLIVYKNAYVDGELADSSITSDYTVEIISGNQLVEDGYVFTASGLFAATVKSDGYVSASVTFKVNDSRSLTQKLILNSLPSKTHYALGDRFDDEGLSLSLYTEYYDSKNKKISRTQTVDDYEIFIDGVAKESYSYSGYGLKRADIRYAGYENTIHLYFSTFCLKDEYSPTAVSDKELMEEDVSTLSLSIENPDISGDGAVLTPDETEVDYDLHEFSNANSYIAQRYAPSVGDVPLLVVPVVIPGNEDLATSSNYDVIRKAFCGSSNDLNFESLHSYYYKSSYGKLDFHFTLTDYYYLETDSIEFNSVDSLTGASEDTIYALSQDCLDWAASTYNLDLCDYDYDRNGAVDGIWMVYMAPYKTRGEVFWAFSGYGNETLNLEKPVANTYGWLSYEFLKGQYAYDDSNNPDEGLDAHVLIHETGHMLGLDDYYDCNKITAEAASYDPLGSIDMMSSDIGDMNPYSKLMLGWTSPYVVLGNGSLKLRSFQSKDNVVLLYDNEKTINDFQKIDGKYRLNLFDEYVALDYYTPNGLNAQDYPAYNVESVKESGLRVYHVDNRLTKVNYDETNGYTFSILDNPDDVLDYSGKDLYRGITNTLNETIDLIGDNGFDEVRWISTSKEKFGYYSDTSNRVFKEGESFSVSENDAQFIDGAFDNGHAFSYIASVESIG